VAPPTPSLDLTSIQDRVVEIACASLRPDQLESGEQGALVRSAYVAAASLLVVPLDELTDRVLALPQPWLLRQTLHDLEPTLGAWSGASSLDDVSALG
jgi:hypothetical protein